MSCYTTRIGMCHREPACDTLEVKEIFPVTTVLKTNRLHKPDCIHWTHFSVITFTLTMFIFFSSAIWYLQVHKVEKMFQGESVGM